MNQEIKAKWVEALRSGEYKQGHGKLNQTIDNSYCCLGVLCDLASKAGVVQRQPINDCYLYRGPGERGSWGFLPLSVQDWAGLSHNPMVDGTHLTTCNDDNGMSFNKIADLIEEHL